MENRKKEKKNPFLIIAAVVIVIAFGVIALEVIWPNLSGGKVSALSKIEITLDDDKYTVSDDDTVIIPAGRPRVPQIICEDPDVEVYQAFFPDDAEVATAQLRRGDESRTITFIKDESLGLEDLPHLSSGTKMLHRLPLSG